jgi:hypothetical protein
MKIKIFIAVLFLITGLSVTLDWVIFSIKNGNLPFNEIKANYINRFPASIAEFYSHNTTLVTFLLFSILLTSGLLFLSERKTFSTILGILSLVFSSWQLFSLM